MVESYIGRPGVKWCHKPSLVAPRPRVVVRHDVNEIHIPAKQNKILSIAIEYARNQHASLTIPVKSLKSASIILLI